MMLADARLPTGGHTQSAGLEPAVRAGLGADGRRLTRSRPTPATGCARSTAVEAGTAVVARHARRWPGGGSRCASGRTGRRARPARRCGPRRTRLGRGYLRLAERIWPARARAPGRATPRSPRPVVLGVVAAVDRPSARQVARLSATTTPRRSSPRRSSCCRSTPSRPRAGWSACTPTSTACVGRRSPTSTDPRARIPAHGAPLVDAVRRAPARHERMRLFHA